MERITQNTWVNVENIETRISVGTGMREELRILGISRNNI